MIPRITLLARPPFRSGALGGLSGPLRFLRVRSANTENERTALAGKEEQTISHLRGKNGQEIILIGTAHISEKSAQQVRDVIESVKPGVVFLELCEQRARKMEREVFSPNEATAIQEAFRNSNVPWLQSLAQPFGAGGIPEYWIKFGYSLLTSIGFVPGVEFRAALKTVHEMRQSGTNNAELIFGDVPIDVTLDKLKKAVSTFDLIRLMANPPKVDPHLQAELEEFMKQTNSDSSDANLKAKIEAKVEAMKYRPLVTKWVSLGESHLPKVVDVMLHQRDQHMVNQLRKLTSPKVVGVVGLAHLDGIEARWEKE